MAGAGGLALILLAGLLAFAITLGTIVASGYALFTSNAQKGRRFGILAIVGSALAILLSTPFWSVVLSGKDTHGERFDYTQGSPIVVLVALEAAVFAAALVGTLLQRARLRRRTR